MDQRIKGQEVTAFMTQNSSTLAQIDSIQDLGLTAKFNILEEGYLGETTNRYDEVFNGISGDLTMHMTSGAVFDFLQSIMNRARRRTAGVVFNLKTTLQFPNGDRRRVIIDDVSFGDLPITMPKRDQYVALKLTIAASSGRFLA